MGSSVLHGGMSTYVAILVLSQGKLYSVIIFFRVWVCIIGYGLLNGIVLLPVILSFIGPVDYKEEKVVENKNIDVTEKKQEEQEDKVDVKFDIGQQQQH